jgi:lipid-binding SYLF domain-containing protein
MGSTSTRNLTPRISNKKEKRKMKAMRLSSTCFPIMLVALFSLAISPAIGAEDIKPRGLVDYARLTVDNFVADPDMTWVRAHMKDAKGVLIVPRLGKGAFMIGGSGGRGVLLTRDEKTGTWSEPVFYSLGSVSFGFQVGGQTSEVILMVMKQGGVERLYTSSVKLGADFSVAAGPVGIGAAAKGVTADVVSFARAKGAFAGGSLEGAVIKVGDTWNSAYYGKPVRPVDILVTRGVTNPHSAELQKALKSAEKKGEQELAAAGPSKMVYAKTTINIRSGPGMNYSVIRQATKGQELEYISLEGDWYKLKVAEDKAQEWVHRSVVVPENPTS